MDARELPQFQSLMAQLAEVYQAQLTEAQADGYWLALRDLPLRDVRSGMQEAFRTCAWFPKPVEIRRCAYAGETEPEPSRRALPEPTSETVRQDNLRKIKEILDKACSGIVKPFTPAEDPDFKRYYDLGRLMLDERLVGAAERESIAAMRKKLKAKMQPV